jgi:hypothetical protein
VVRLAEHLDVLLAGVVADPTRPVLELPLLTDAEHRRLGHGFADAHADAMPMPT